MKLLTEEWIEKADGDFATANRELRVRKAPNYDSVCFHCQQCAEKYMKASLQEQSVYFPKTHNSPDLINLLLPLDPFWSTFEPHARALTSYAIDFRYPGRKATREEASEAVKLCTAIRDYARQTIGLT